MTKKKSVDEVRRDLMERIQTEGVEAAYEAGLDVCRDKAAPPSARSTAMTTMFRAAGYFEKSAADIKEKELHEMTMEELQEAGRRARAKINQYTDDEEDASDIFD